MGSLILFRECAVFARTLGALLGAGIPLIRALRVSREVVGNAVLGVSLDQVEEDVRGGAGLGLSLEKPGSSRPCCTSWLRLARSPAVLRISSQVGGDLRHAGTQSDVLTGGGLQPALIIFLAIAVGGITITMLSAVFSMNAVEF